MRKFCLIFMTVVFSVMCMSVSAFASESCVHGDHYSGFSIDSNTRLITCDHCSEPLCGHCMKPEVDCACRAFHPYVCSYCGIICECHLCGVCGAWAPNNGVCCSCGNFEWYCTCEPMTSDVCDHLLWSEVYLNEDGTLNHFVCKTCGIEVLCDDPMWHEYVTSLVCRSYQYGECTVYRGSNVYTSCEHLASYSMDSAYLYIDQYGLLNGVCTECNVMGNVSYMLGDFRTVTGLTESDISVLMDYGELMQMVQFRLDSHDGFLTTRCECGWFDPASEFSVARVNGKHELYCPDCEGVYTGALVYSADLASYECSGADCAVCRRMGIEKDIVLPADSKTLTDYVTDTGSIVSGGLNMASATAQTVADNPILLLLYAIPFTAIAVIVYRKVKH